MSPVPRLRAFGAVLGASLVLVAIAFVVGARKEKSAPAADARFRGVCFVAGGPVEDAPFAALREAGVTWISQTPFGWQDRVDDPEFRLVTAGRILWGETDEGLRATTQRARAYRIRTLLKPHIWLRDRTGGQWEGDIAMRSEADWQRWFASYENFIVHYARLAQETGMEALSVGTELEGTTHREQDWRRVIARVREVYDGPLTYSANWSGEFERIAFWDALDFAGVQAYFPLSDADDPSLDSLVAGWQPHRERLAAWSARVNRPVAFTEVGYRAAMAAAAEPWLWRTTHGANPALQERCYEAVFQTFWQEPWFRGTFWWKWYPHGAERRARDDSNFTPQGRPAERVMAKWYLAEG